MKNRIMIISKNLTGGGAERVATNLAGCLSKFAEVLFVVLSGQNNTYGTTAKTIDLNLPENKGKFKVLWHYNAYKKDKKIKKDFKPTHCISFMAEPDLANVLSKGNEKIIISVRNKRSSSNPTKFHLWKNKWVFSKADAIVSLSQMVKKDLVEFFDISEDIITPIYNPCYTEIIQKKCREDVFSIEEKNFFEKNKEKIVITAGRLNIQKGQWHLIRAFKKVVDEISDAKLVILGQGEEKDYLKNLIRDLNLENNVFIYGFKANPYPYLNRASVFAFPSVFEGLGNILIECMACQLPVVSADCPYGPKELLSPEEDFDSFVSDIDYAQYGVLVPPMDGKKYSSMDPLKFSEECMANAIIEMLNNQKLREDYKERITNRGKDFSPDKITEQWLNVIKKL